MGHDAEGHLEDGEPMPFRAGNALVTAAGSPRFTYAQYTKMFRGGDQRARTCSLAWSAAACKQLASSFLS